MRIIRHTKFCAPEAKGGVIALGNFDGLHLGHKKVIDAARELAKKLGKPSGLMTFEPHPRRLFRPEMIPDRLTPLRLKARIIAQWGIDFLFVQRFDVAFSRITARDFFTHILVGDLQASHIVVGYDFIFGHKREGNTALLSALCQEFGVGFTLIEPQYSDSMTDGGMIYSSTQIRALLQEGDIALANTMLGRAHSVQGRVIEGDKRGRTLGFPTANIRLKTELALRFGVYAVRVAIDGTLYDGVANFGVRPSFGQNQPLLEVHLFNYNRPPNDGSLYGKRMKVEFIALIRHERRFTSLESLTAQIRDDCQKARERLYLLA